jgi:hypothetical protein
MTRRTARTIGALLAPSIGLLISVQPADARPDLRLGRPAGPLTVYPDDSRRTLFYYPPGELAIATRSDGSPDIHLLHARYTGSVVTGDQGTSVIRSVFTVRVVMSGPTPAQLAAVRQSLAGAAGSGLELRPLPIRRVESAIVYAGAADHGAPAETPLPRAHIESTEAAPPREGYWTERVFTLGLGPQDAQLLSTALARGSVALGIGYAFLSDGPGPDQPLQQLSGSPALVDELRKAIEPPKPAADPDDAGRDAARPVMVRVGAVGVTADIARWPGIVTRVDINESAPPGYAALDVYCYDFHQPADSPLYEKQVVIEAASVGGARVTLTATFNRSQPDLYARGMRFPVAVRLDRPFRFRIVRIAQDGTSTSTAWRDRTSWTALLDVTGDGGLR